MKKGKEILVNAWVELAEPDKHKDKAPHLSPSAYNQDTFYMYPISLYRFELSTPVTVIFIGWHTLYIGHMVSELGFPFLTMKMGIRVAVVVEHSKDSVFSPTKYVLPEDIVTKAICLRV